MIPLLVVLAQTSADPTADPWAVAGGVAAGVSVTGIAVLLFRTLWRQDRGWQRLLDQEQGAVTAAMGRAAAAEVRADQAQEDASLARGEAALARREARDALREAAACHAEREEQAETIRALTRKMTELQATVARYTEGERP